MSKKEGGTGAPPVPPFWCPPPGHNNRDSQDTMFSVAEMRGYVYPSCVNVQLAFAHQGTSSSAPSGSGVGSAHVTGMPASTKLRHIWK